MVTSLVVSEFHVPHFSPGCFMTLIKVPVDESGGESSAGALFPVSLDASVADGRDG
jgi:hypothetical protein